LSLLFSALSASAMAEEKSNFFDLKASPESQISTYLDEEGADKLKGVRRVLVPQFRVEFQLRTEAGGRYNNNAASVYLHLKGIDDALMQQITDAAYRDFLKEMKTAGIEVIGSDMLAKDPEFAAVQKIGQTSPAVLETKDGISHFFAPTGSKVYMLLRRSDQDRQGFGSSLSTGFADLAREVPIAEIALSRKYQAPCMKVMLTIAPGQVSISGWNGVGLIGDAVTLINGSSDVLPALTMLEESRVVFRSESHSANDTKMFGGKRFLGQKIRDFSEEGDSAIFLKQPLLIADQISTRKMEETTGAGSQVLNAATTVNKVAKVGGLLGALGGFVPFGGALAPVAQVAQVAQFTGNQDHHEYTIDADPKLFSDSASREIGAATRMILARVVQAVGAPAAEKGSIVK
jgi:hypothetical protein